MGHELTAKELALSENSREHWQKNNNNRAVGFRTTRRLKSLGFISRSTGASALDDEANAGPAVLVGANKRHACIFQNPHQKLRVGCIDRGGTVDGFGAIDGAWRQPRDL